MRRLVSTPARPTSARAIPAGLALARLAPAALALALLTSPAPAAEGRPPGGNEVRCLAMIAYAEAAVDGLPGMAAVIRVVRNRMADPRFPRDACAVIAEPRQFQPVTEAPVLRQVARDPEAYSIPQILKVRSPAARLLLADAHRLARSPRPGPDPTGGALYFLNPAYMDPANCPWFAKLRRTAQVGSHLFLTDRGPADPARPPALDCAAIEAARAEAGGVPES